MSVEKIFVGRKAELEQFKEVIENPKGQAVLVVGQAGMGKTWLVNKMAEIAENHPELKCGWVRYEVTPTDSVDSTMALMMDNAFEAAQVTEGSFNGTSRRLEQWKSLLNVINIGDLVMSLKRDPAKNTREQFLERLELISKRMPKEGRAIFVIDPEKYMQEDSDQSWAIVVKELPEKIKFVFAQRPEDVLVESETFGALDNVLQIPEERLDILEEESVEELLTIRSKGIKCTVTEVREVLRRYEGHPYALGAALDLIEGGTKLEELPEKPKPTKFAEVQWREVSNRSEDAIRLFKGYAIIEVGVPDDVVEAVSEIDSDTRQHLVADKYIRGLLREEGEGRRIYHAILADYILGQIGEDEKKEYHSRAVKVYRGKLKKSREEQTKPDALAAMRLAEHVLEAEGKEAFVHACAYETYGPLNMLGLLDVTLGFSKRALDMVEKGSKEEASVRCTMGLAYRTKGDLDEAEKLHLRALEIEKEGQREVGMAREYGNLGLIYRTKGDLDQAEEMHNKSLDIHKKLGRLEGMARQYGNLGLIYRTKGDLDKAEEMHNKSLDIHKKLGRLEGMARQYGNLGLIYRTKGDLDKAEDMHNKSLEINKKLGRLEGMANQYGNLGLIYRTRGDLDQAEDMQNKSLEINKNLGCLEGMASNYGNLGNVYQTRGDLDEAEKMYQRVLEIEEKLGRPDSIANAYANLGAVYRKRGNIGKVKEYWEKALGLFKKIGMPHEVEKIEKLIIELED